MVLPMSRPLIFFFGGGVQLLAGHVVGSWPAKRKKKLHSMEINIVDMIIHVKLYLWDSQV